MAKKKYTNKVKDSVIYLYPNEYGLGGDILGGIKSGIGSSLAGTAINLGLKGLGALGKAAFSSQINQDKVNEINALNTALNTLQLDTSSNDSLLSQWGSQSFGSDFTQKDIGHDGWFRNKAKRTYNRLLGETESAESRALDTYGSAFANADIQRDTDILANFVAYGGPIHIKKENRGAFTKYCGGEVTQECINKGKNSPNPLTRKRANFADVARKWHSAGGPINMITDAPMSPFGNRFAYGGDFDNGVTVVGNGGSHEMNPNDGVQMGVDPNGVPNLVEEKEVIYNDYVYSKRIKVPEEFKHKYKLRGKDLSFADAAKQMQKESEERPNDPISKKGLEANLSALANEQEIMRNKNNIGQEGNKYAGGGSKKGFAMTGPYPYSMLDYSPDYSYFIGNGPSIFPEVNTIDNTTVEEPKQTNANNSKVVAIKSEPNVQDRIKYTAERLPGNVLGVSSSRPMPIDLNSMSSLLPDMERRGKQSYNDYLKESRLKDIEERETKRNSIRNTLANTYRHTPILGSALGLGLSSRTPDYTNANAIATSGRNLRDVEYKPIGNYLKYTPFDTEYYINKAEAQGAANRRAIKDMSGGNRATAMAGLLASDYNTIGKTGDLARQAAEYNLAQRQKVEEFNRGTNVQNSQGMLQADIANMSNDKARMDAAIRAAGMREEIDARRAAAISANLSGLFDNIGNVGREQYIMNMIKNNPYLIYDSSGTYKGKKAAKGGLLTIKRGKK